MSDLIWHDRTAADVDRFLASPSHAIALIAPGGAGKRAIADHIAGRLLGRASDTLGGYAYFHLITPEKTSIPIEAIRNAQQFAKLKVPGRAGGVQRVILIEHAHLMGGEAQNALLKLLEEPPEGLLLLLTTANERALLPTILSRLQLLRVRPPGRQPMLDHFAGAGTSEDVQKAYLVSGGLPGLMHALVHDQDHPLRESVNQARGLLAADPLERFGLIDAIGKSRDDSIQLTMVLQRMARAALRQAAATGGAATTAIRRWTGILQAGYDAESALRQSAQPKLVLTNLLLNL